MSMIHVPSDVVVLAMDVHKNSISTGVLEPDETSVVVDKVGTDDESVRRLMGRFGDPSRVWACYEAGPTGYELARVLGAAGMRCEVIAPSLIPTAPGDRVKTDKRDAQRLARLFRAGQLTAVRVPTPAEEAVAGSVSGQGGHGDRPDSGSSPARQVLVASRPGLAGRV